MEFSVRRKFVASISAEITGLDLRQYIPHGICRLFLRGRCDMGIGVQREARREVAQHPGDCLDVHTVLQGQGRERMPLRYNYDKPENPVISRIFWGCG